MPFSIQPTERLAFARPDQSRSNGREDRDSARSNICLRWVDDLHRATDVTGFVDKLDEWVHRNRIRRNPLCLQPLSACNSARQQFTDSGHSFRRARRKMGQAFRFKIDEIRWGYFPA